MVSRSRYSAGASLISYRQIARELPQGKKQYFGLFTLSNLIFLALLLGVWFLLRCRVYSAS